MDCCFNYIWNNCYVLTFILSLKKSKEKPIISWKGMIHIKLLMKCLGASNANPYDLLNLRCHVWILIKCHLAGSLWTTYFKYWYCQNCDVLCAHYPKYILKMLLWKWKIKFPNRAPVLHCSTDCSCKLCCNSYDTWGLPPLTIAQLTAKASFVSLPFLILPSKASVTGLLTEVYSFPFC